MRRKTTLTRPAAFQLRVSRRLRKVKQDKMIEDRTNEIYRLETDVRASRPQYEIRLPVPHRCSA